MKKVVVVGSFDDLRSRHVRLLERASELGDVHVSTITRLPRSGPDVWVTTVHWSSCPSRSK